MTDDELSELKDAKAAYYTEILELKEKIKWFELETSKLRCQLISRQQAYREADREIAEATKVTTCQPGQSGKKKYGVCGLTKRQLLNLLEELEMEEEDEDE